MKRRHDILFVNFFPSFLKYDDASVVETPNVASGNAQIDLTDLYVAFFFRIDDGVVHAALRGFEINDLAFSHSARGHIAHSDDFQTPIASRFCDNRADFRSANFKPYEDIVSGHSIELSVPTLIPAAIEDPAPSSLPGARPSLNGFNLF